MFPPSLSSRLPAFGADGAADATCVHRVDTQQGPLRAAASVVHRCLRRPPPNQSLQLPGRPSGVAGRRCRRPAAELHPLGDRTSMVSFCASLKGVLARRSFLFMSCALVVALYLLSVFCSASFYGASFSGHLRCAQFGVFWGGDELSRNNYLYNSGIWPPHPDVHFAGLPWPNDRWTFRGPYIPRLRERLKYQGPLRSFGLRLPACRSRSEGASIVLPMGWLLILPWLLLFVHIRCRPCSPGHCKSCGYLVCGAPSARCPECGRSVA